MEIKIIDKIDSILERLDSDSKLLKEVFVHLNKHPYLYMMKKDGKNLLQYLIEYFNDPDIASNFVTSSFSLIASFEIFKRNINLFSKYLSNIIFNDKTEELKAIKFYIDFGLVDYIPDLSAGYNPERFIDTLFMDIGCVWNFIKNINDAEFLRFFPTPIIQRYFRIKLVHYILENDPIKINKILTREIFNYSSEIVFYEVNIIWSTNFHKNYQRYQYNLDFIIDLYIMHSEKKYHSINYTSMQKENNNDRFNNIFTLLRENKPVHLNMIPMNFFMYYKYFFSKYIEKIFLNFQGLNIFYINDNPLDTVSDINKINNLTRHNIIHCPRSIMNINRKKLLSILVDKLKEFLNDPSIIIGVTREHVEYMDFYVEVNKYGKIAFRYYKSENQLKIDDNFDINKNTTGKDILNYFKNKNMFMDFASYRTAEIVINTFSEIMLHKN